MAIEPDVVFNMYLANGSTSARFCYEAASVLGLDIQPDDITELELGEDSEYISEIVDEWTTKLSDAGYYVWWDAGDVVVYDLRPLSDDEREQFYSEMENV